MPLTEIRTLSQDTLLGLWAVQESPAQLAAALSDLAPTLPQPGFAHPNRQREWLAARLLAYTLLRQCTPDFFALEADACSKPFFRDSPFHVSLSHSADLVAVLLSGTHEVGIDLEYIRPKIKALAPKFLNEPENQMALDEPDKLCVLWSAKETLYKLYGKKKLLFKEHLHLVPTVLTGAGHLRARILTPTAEEHHVVQYERLGNHVLTYCLGASR